MSKFKVFIADGTASVRQFIRYTLEDHFKGVEFEVATNGKNVKKRLESTHYDLVLYDRDMPLLNGDELLKWLRNHESLKNTPVIMISGDRNEESLRKVMSLGADAYLIKPLLMGPLVEKVNVIFGKFERNKFDRRKFKRFIAQGIVILQYNTRSIGGRLINISLGGLLASFDSTGSLPQILNKAMIRIELENKRCVEGIEGYIVRLQVVDSFVDAKQVHIALQFADEIGTETKKELVTLLASLKQ